MSKRDELWGVFAARRAEAIWKADTRREAAYKEYPALLEMDRQIAEAGSRYCLAALHGEAAEAAEQALQALHRRKADFMAEHGLDFEPKFRCTRCGDSGMAEDGMCDCFRRELIAENFRSSNLEQALTDQSFENFDLTLFSDIAADGLLSPRENMRRLKALAEDYVANFDRQMKSLLFSGATGLGKTYLSTAIARALLEQGKSVIYISAPELARLMETTRFKDEEGRMEDLWEADMLIIDDLGVEGRTAYILGALTDLMDRRIRAGKPMLFSTNLNLEGIQKAYDERVTSRIFGHFIYCYFYGEDLRIKAFKAGQ